MENLFGKYKHKNIRDIIYTVVDIEPGDIVLLEANDNSRDIRVSKADFKRNYIKISI